MMNTFLSSIRQALCKHRYGQDFKEITEDPDKYTLHFKVGRKCLKCGRVEAQIWTAHRANEDAIKLLVTWLEKEGLLDDYCEANWGSFYYCEFRSRLSRIFVAEGPESARQYIESVLAGRCEGNDRRGKVPVVR